MSGIDDLFIQVGGTNAQLIKPTSGDIYTVTYTAWGGYQQSSTRERRTLGAETYVLATIGTHNR